MIRDALINGIVQFAHRNREMGSEPVGLFAISWIVDERFDEDPIEFELAYETTIGAGKCVSGSEAFSSPLVAVRESAAP